MNLIIIMCNKKEAKQKALIRTRDKARQDIHLLTLKLVKAFSHNFQLETQMNKAVTVKKVHFKY